MVKLVFAVRRLPHLSREEFQRYWREVHGPLVKERAEAMGIRRYVQSHTIETPINAGLQAGRGGPDAYDGVAELWWDSIDDLLASGSTDAGRQAARELLEDERRFVDLANSPLFLVDEKPVV